MLFQQHSGILLTLYEVEPFAVGFAIVPPSGRIAANFYTGRIILFAFGDIYNWPGLNLCEREMITITSLLTTGGCESQLAVHINGVNAVNEAKKYLRNATK